MDEIYETKDQSCVKRQLTRRRRCTRQQGLLYPVLKVAVHVQLLARVLTLASLLRYGQIWRLVQEGYPTRCNMDYFREKRCKS